MTFGWEALSAVRPVQVELFTAGYLISGTIQTRFSRVAEILNQLSSPYLPVEHARVREHGAESDQRAASTSVAVEEILVMLAPGLADTPSGDLRVPKQAIDAHLAVPPLWLSGQIYVPVGSRPTDGLLNLADRFVPMTNLVLSSAAHPALARECPIAAVRRDRAHVIQFTSADDGDGGADSGGANATEPAEPSALG